MKDQRLASNYAGALLSILTDSQQAEQADAFLGAVRDLTSKSRQFRDLMRDPAVAQSARKKVLVALAASKGMPKTVQDFLAVVVDHNRSRYLANIAVEYHRLLQIRMGVVQAEITTASPLSPELQQRTQSALEKQSGRRVQLTCKVEPGLLGGAVTKIGSKIIDGSLKTQLAQLRQQMVQE